MSMVGRDMPESPIHNNCFVHTLSLTAMAHNLPREMHEHVSAPERASS